jgi:hypothetical protein
MREEKKEDNYAPIVVQMRRQEDECSLHSEHTRKRRPNKRRMINERRRKEKRADLRNSREQR